MWHDLNTTDEENVFSTCTEKLATFVDKLSNKVLKYCGKIFQCNISFDLREWILR